MHAAVVRSFAEPPNYETFASPAAAGEHEIVVDVLAAALHPRVRSAANGTHYTSSGVLPMIPGFDGVGRDPDGALRYFILPDTHLGSMAEQAVIDRRRSAPLPPETDVAAVAAGINPAMSSWVALHRRIQFAPGQRVLVLGATGSAGGMAVRIARTLGAGELIAAGRDPLRLAALSALGADRLVSLAGEPDDCAQTLAEAAADVDVVIDYLWGPLTEAAIPAMIRRRTDPSAPLHWIEIGSMSGRELTLPSAWLRAANLRLLGSGQGSASTEEIVAELPALAALITDGSLPVSARTVPLAAVREMWSTASEARVVFVP